MHIGRKDCWTGYSVVCRTGTMLVLVCLLSGFSLLHSLPAHANAGDPLVYVTNDADGTVSMIDSGTNAVLATIPVGSNPRGVIVSPDRTRVYVSNFANCCAVQQGTVSVIDATTNTVMASIPVGNNPNGMAITSDGKTLYVANWGYPPDLDNRVFVIDTSTNTVSSTITIPVSGWDMTLSPDNTRLYISSQTSNVVSVIDTSTQSILRSLPISSPHGLAVSPDGSRLYIVGIPQTYVTVIDTVTFATITTIDMGSAGCGFGAVLNSAGTRLYVTNGLSDPHCTPGVFGVGNGKVTVIDTQANTVMASIPVGSAPDGLDILPDDSRVYVANNGSVIDPSSNTTSVIDTATNTVVATIPVGLNPFAVATAKNFMRPHLIALAPAQVWIGLKNSDDVGIKFDLLAEVSVNGVPLTSGELDGIAGGSSGFNNAHLQTISFAAFNPVDFPAGSTLSLTLSVRNTCSGHTHNAGTARLWFNDSAANSQFGATIGGSSSTYYLLSGFTLGTSAGPGPKVTIDVAAGSPCSAFKPFGTWTLTL